MLGVRGHGHQNVAGVGDGAVGQHALDVRLLERGEVADDHGGERADPDDGLPAGGDGAEGGHEDAQQNREGGGFGAYGEECGNGGGRALIDVGSPDLEGGGGNLEAESDEHEGGCGSGQG